MDGGIGNDQLYLAASVTNTTATIFGGDGDDFGYIGKHADGSAGGNVINNGITQLIAGSGNDRFFIANNSLLQFYGSLGDGDDSAETGFNTLTVQSVLDGGLGRNTIKKTSTQNMLYYNFV